MKEGRKIMLSHCDETCLIYLKTRCGISVQHSHTNIGTPRMHVESVHTHIHSLKAFHCLLPIRHSNKSSQTKNDMMLLSFSGESTYPWKWEEQRGWSVGKIKRVFSGNFSFIPRTNREVSKKEHSDSLYFFSYRYIPYALKKRQSLRCEHLPT